MVFIRELAVVHHVEVKLNLLLGPHTLRILRVVVVLGDLGCQGASEGRRLLCLSGVGVTVYY